MVYMPFNEIIKEIKNKPEFRGIPDEIVKEFIQKYLNLQKDFPKNFSKSEKKSLIKKVRAELHALSGRFQADIKKRKRLLEEGKIEELLKTHSSTKERLSFYPELKKVIEKLKINSILDLGSGLNPFALANPNITYYAADINQEELELINNFFKKFNIKGKAFFYDLRYPEEELPKADLCLFFKVFDIIEKKGHKLAEKIIRKTPSRYLLISFSTRTLSGRPMNHPQRGWIEQLAKRLGFSFEIIKSKNEIFYLIKKY